MRSQGSAWRARRRAQLVSHHPHVQPAALTELLGGRNVRQLTRAQRLAVADLLERHGDLASVDLRESVAGVLGDELPTRRLMRLLRQAVEKGA
jgi:hypothetical protein